MGASEADLAPDLSTSMPPAPIKDGRALIRSAGVETSRAGRRAGAVRRRPGPCRAGAGGSRRRDGRDAGHAVRVSADEPPSARGRARRSRACASAARDAAAAHGGRGSCAPRGRPRCLLAAHGRRRHALPRDAVRRARRGAARAARLCGEERALARRARIAAGPGPDARGRLAGCGTRSSATSAPEPVAAQMPTSVAPAVRGAGRRRDRPRVSPIVALRVGRHRAARRARERRSAAVRASLANADLVWSSLASSA